MVYWDVALPQSTALRVTKLRVRHLCGAESGHRSMHCKECHGSASVTVFTVYRKKE